MPTCPAPARARAAPEISVVVPAGGRIDLLDRCLDALARQQLCGDRFEVLVVGGAPHAPTRQLVAVWHASCTAGPAFRYLPRGAAAGQGGWRQARAPLLAFISEDAIAAPGWLRHGLAAFGEHVDALRGQVDIPLAGAATDDALRRRRIGQSQFSMANCFCRKRVLEQLGGVDERFGASWHAGSDLHFRLLGLGANIAAAPHAVVVQPLPTPAWGASLAQPRSLQLDALLYKKHPALYRQAIKRAPRYDELAAVLALLLAVLGLAGGSAALAGPAGLAWLLNTAHLCLRRLRGASRSPAQLLEIAVAAVLGPPLAVFWRTAGAIRYRVPFA